MIETIEQANQTLEQIGAKRRAIAVVQSRFNAQLAEINKRMDKEISGDQAELERLENELKDFMQNNISLFQKKKTVALTFGSLHSRKTPARLELDTAESWPLVLENLQRFKMNRFIEIKRSPNKTAIKKSMTLEDMKKIGVKKVQDIRYEYKTI